MSGDARLDATARSCYVRHRTDNRLGNQKNRVSRLLQATSWVGRPPMANRTPLGFVGARSGSTRPIDTWRGHLPITSEMLLSILERAAASENVFSRAERILFTTCEFWAAIATRSIATHLGSEALDNLRNAIYAFSAI